MTSMACMEMARSLQTLSEVVCSWLLIALFTLQMLSSRYPGTRHQTWSPVAAQMIRCLCGRYDAAHPDMISTSAGCSKLVHGSNFIVQQICKSISQILQLPQDTCVHRCRQLMTQGLLQESFLVIQPLYAH